MNESSRSLRAALPRPRALIPAVAAMALATLLPAQRDGVSREQMWYAPTAEDWQRPVLIEFQRSWADALQVAAETGKAILICVNMDGEIASEHYAGVRYRSPEIAKLYEPYVCVIASTYRHNPRDHDEHGHRIPCPRFGSVTCGEHIAIEPLLYERYFDGTRVAPRHIMVELDGSESYDVYYAFDTDSVFAAIRNGIEQRAEQPAPIVRGDRTIVERVASRAAADRKAVEQAWQSGDDALRAKLLAAAAANPDAAPHELLRLAVRGFDPELAAQARAALANSDELAAVDVIADALRSPMPEAERDGLIAALRRIGADSAQARTLAIVHEGLGSDTAEVDASAWRDAERGGASYAAPPGRATLERQIEEAARAAASEDSDPESRLALAESTLAIAVDPESTSALGIDRRSESKFARLMFEDARRAALEAERLGAKGWRTDAVIAVASHYLGDREAAYQRAEQAMPDIPAGATEWTAISTIAIFADGRHRAIADAARNKREWPGKWLSDASAAYSILARHPLGTDVQVASHYDLLAYLRADERAGRVLDEGLARFPASATLHDCLRQRILRDQGISGLETVYAERLERDEQHPSLPWFAAYAAVVEAEFRRRRSDPQRALAAYDRSLQLFDRAIEADPACLDSADHFAAIALAGRARLALEAGELERALRDTLASFERRPGSAASLDGLNLSAVDTAKMLRAQLVAQERGDALATLDAALGALDPSMLELPAYERPAGRAPGAGGGRRADGNPPGGGAPGRRR